MRLFDLDLNATVKAARNLFAQSFDVTRCLWAEEVVEGAHIIVTCTADKQNATILTDNMVRGGQHINAIGGDCPGKTELRKNVLLRSDIFVE